jgi:hypothetical protein
MSSCLSLAVDISCNVRRRLCDCLLAVKRTILGGSWTPGISKHHTYCCVAAAVAMGLAAASASIPHWALCGWSMLGTTNDGGASTWLLATTNHVL